MEVSVLASCPCHFTLRETTHSTHWTGGWVDPRACLDVMEKREILPLPEIKYVVTCEMLKYMALLGKGHLISLTLFICYS
jgi:hypothetical protein